MLRKIIKSKSQSQLVGATAAQQASRRGGFDRPLVKSRHSRAPSSRATAAQQVLAPQWLSREKKCESQSQLVFEHADGG